MNEQRAPKPSPLAGEGAERQAAKQAKPAWQCREAGEGAVATSPHPAARRLPARRLHPLPQGKRVTSLRHGTWSSRNRVACSGIAFAHDGCGA